MGKNSKLSAFPLSREGIDRYIRHLEAEGKGSGTVRKYRRVLYEFYSALPEGKLLYRETFEQYLQPLKETYSTSTLNSMIAAYNSLMAFLDHREYQYSHLRREEESQPELSREEYFGLLAVARSSGEMAGYLLVKLFANTDLRVQEVETVTAEAVKAGTIRGEEGRRIPLPGLLRRELLYYVESEGIPSGPVFRTRTGNPMDRVAVHRQIAELGREAGVAKEKANQRALHRLYGSTMDSLLEQYRPMIEQSYEQMLETEQLVVAWNANRRWA